MADVEAIIVGTRDVHLHADTVDELCDASAVSAFRARCLSAPNASALFVSNDRCLVLEGDDAVMSALIVIHCDYLLRDGYGYPPSSRIDTRDRGVFDCRLTRLEGDPQSLRGTLELSLRSQAFTRRMFYTVYNSEAIRVPTHVVVSAFSPHAGHVADCLSKHPAGSSTEDIPCIMRAITRRSATRMDECDASFDVTLPLHRHQTYNVHWMQQRERVGLTDDLWLNMGSYHYSPLLNRFSRRPVVDGRGGILADEMGLGKTISVASLIQTSHDTTDEIEPSLVICPVSLVGQWVSELRRVLGRHNVYMYHGGHRKRQPEVLRAYAAVVTSYEICASEDTVMRRKAVLQGDMGYTPPLTRIQWARVVVDEAHRLRSSYTSVHSALMDLRARARWCVTGTPFCFDVDDVVGVLKFLRAEVLSPSDHFGSRPGMHQHWRYVCNRPMPALKSIMCAISTRTVDAGDIIPSAIYETISIDLSPPERERYGRLLADVRVGQLNMSMMALMQAVTHLRRLCNGEQPTDNVMPGDIVVESMFVRAEEVETEPPEDPCAVCFEQSYVTVRLPCRHAFCVGCVSTICNANMATRCPMCRAGFRYQQCRITHAVAPEEAKEGDPTATDDGTTSKLAHLQQHVQQLLSGNADTKILVFSQWSTAAICAALHRVKIPTLSLNGSMARSKRTKILNQFNAAGGPSVFVLNTRSGSVGLNLVAANAVILFEPAMNSAIAKQAVGRVLRLGQMRDVRVFRYVARNTVEEKIDADQGDMMSISGTGDTDTAYSTTTWNRQFLERLVS